MTPTNDTPGAAEALSLAFDIVKTPCSAAETQRAEVLLGIAREIRQEAQYRATRSALTLTMPTKLAPAAAEAPPADPEATAVVPLDYGQRYQDDPAITQRIRVPWQVGDKAECKNCRTPIYYDYVLDAGRRPTGEFVWRHKYTGQAVCVEPSFATGRDTAIVHTFAEPSIE